MIEITKIEKAILLPKLARARQKFESQLTPLIESYAYHMDQIVRCSSRLSEYQELINLLDNPDLGPDSIEVRYAMCGERDNIKKFMEDKAQYLTEVDLNIKKLEESIKNLDNLIKTLEEC